MLRNDFEMLLTAVFVAAIVVFAEFGTITKSVDSLADSYDQSENFQAFKQSEKKFWSDIKGTKEVGGQINNILTEAPPVEQNPPPVKTDNAKITAPVKFLLVGDSMMIDGFGPALEKSLLKFNGVSVVREGVYSTGLNRIDYFDWFTKTDELIAEHQPDVLIVMFGANDGQGIKDKDGKAHELSSEEWSEVYRQRVAVYLSRVMPKLKKLYWIGNPIAGNDNFTQKFLKENPIFESETAKFQNAVYVNTWDRFAVNGEYRQSIPDDNGLWQIAKKSDGVHVTDFGGAIMSKVVVTEILKGIDLQPTN